MLTLNTFDWGRWLKWPFMLALALSALSLVATIYAAGQPLWAMLVLALASLGFYIYLSKPAQAYRYLFPGLAAMLVFVAFPLVYTAQIGFTNYSSSNLLSQERVTAYLLEQASPDEARTQVFTLHPDGEAFRIVLTPPAGSAPANALALVLVSEPLKLRSARLSAPVVMQAVPQAGPPLAPALPLAQVLQHRDALMRLLLKLPDQTVLSYAGVREFGPLNPLWRANTDGSLTLLQNDTAYQPNHETGFFENSVGERMQPGFKVGVGFANYARMVGDPDFRGPFLSIFIWTVLFSALTVLFSLALGLTLAVVLNWEGLRFRTTYRTLLFLPYAVPGFISILVFKGLFNQNFGEINTILDALFGIKPAWFADPLLAKTMLLLVNTWLGYPYIMVLCAGLIKAIPADLYEASAIAGATPLTNFFKITVPLIIKPLTPLLISAFAFNFNNFVLIALLTNGRPDFLNTKVPAGTTDILVSYTYRIAFQDSGQNFGLAAAISTVIFFMVALLSLANLRLARVKR
ncbi:maltose ABC transporter permease MalF [Rhodoferax sp.]|uniref:maltose ABC transporter permease MalF n=1 Tax=Rhodoferax sp. TaxID=50421 RepID=UPI00275D7CAD|nr:maltose ABC transporter permease MalF [Rhodoferax sp.]